MSTTNKKVSSHFIELQPIDNILHKNDEDSKVLFMSTSIKVSTICKP